MERRHQKQKLTDYSGSSEHLKKDIDMKKVVDVRLKVFLAGLVLVAGILIFRVFTITVVHSDHYKTLLSKLSAKPLYSQTMRGEIYDRNMNPLVTNSASKSIVYNPVSNSKVSKDEAALLFGKTFQIEPKLSEDALKVVWLKLNGLHKLATEAERKDHEKKLISESDYNVLMKSRITQEMMDAIPYDSRVQAEVLKRMSSPDGSRAAVVVADATVEQISYLSEHASLFPGFSYSTSWSREFNRDVKLGGVLGTLGQISANKLDYYLAKGYSQSDLVGTIGLEYQFESLLSGNDSQYTRGEGNALHLSKDGRKGYDIRTTLDLDLQKYIENALQEAIEKVRQDPNRQMFKEMHMVISNPQNGDILAIAAIKRNEDGTYWNDVQSPMLSTGTYPVGSVVKMGTVYMGLSQGVINENELILDTPMYIRGTPVRTSWMAGIGNVNSRTALQHSSNIYMYQTAIRLAGATYVPNGPLLIENPKKTYDLMRKYYSQFGLGIRTEVEFPFEETGYHGGTDNSGNILDFAIGQFDNYNGIELSQYVNTIANGGYRVKPRFVKEGLEHDTKNVVYESQIDVLNSLDNKNALKVVQEGMRLYITSGSGYALGNENYAMAAKSGTAQAYKDGSYVRNSTYLAYAPFEAPKVSISCIAPAAMLDSKGSGVSNVCGTTSTKIMTYYMNREQQEKN